MKVPPKYFDYVNIFSSNLIMVLLKNTAINEYAIKLIEGKSPLYRLIYAFSSIELGTLKAYIETHLKLEFIRLSKAFARVSRLFNKKLDNSLWLCIDYQGLNNLTIKNWYLLFLIGKIFD